MLYLYYSVFLKKLNRTCIPVMDSVMYDNAANIEKGAIHNKKIKNGFDSRGRLELKKLGLQIFVSPPLLGAEVDWFITTGKIENKEYLDLEKEGRRGKEDERKLSKWFSSS